MLEGATVLLASLLIGAGVRGCESQQGSLILSVRAYYQALASRDGAGACRALTPAARARLQSSFGEPCARGVLLITDFVGSAHIRNLELEDPVAVGDRARVLVVDLDSDSLASFPVKLRRVGDRWLVQTPEIASAFAP